VSYVWPSNIYAMVTTTIGLRFDGRSTEVIARQHALHSEHDIVLPVLSVCLSVCLSSANTVSKRMDASSHLFDFLVGASF